MFFFNPHFSHWEKMDDDYPIIIHFLKMFFFSMPIFLTGIMIINGMMIIPKSMIHPKKSQVRCLSQPTCFCFWRFFSWLRAPTFRRSSCPASSSSAATISRNMDLTDSWTLETARKITSRSSINNSLVVDLPYLSKKYDGVSSSVGMMKFRRYEKKKKVQTTNQNMKHVFGIWN